MRGLKKSRTGLAIVLALAMFLGTLQTGNTSSAAGAASALDSTMVAATLSLTADGTSQTEITVSVNDEQGDPLTSGGDSVTISKTGGGTLGAVTDNNDGTYTAMLTSPTTVGSATLTATVNGEDIPSMVEVWFVPGAASAVKSTITAGSTSLKANGTSRTTITVRLKDAQGNSLTVGGDTVEILQSTPEGTLSSVTDNGNGTYKAELTAPTTVGSTTLSAKVNGMLLAVPVTVAFTPGNPDADLSTVTADKTIVDADGNDKATISVALVDSFGRVLSGKRVRIGAESGDSVIVAVNDITDSDGIARFKVSNTTAETVTYYAMEQSSESTMEETVDVTFRSVPTSPPVTPPASSDEGEKLLTSINGKEFQGLAKRKNGADGTKIIEIVLDADSTSVALGALPATGRSDYSVGMASDAERVVLRVPLAILRRIKEKTDSITLLTALGQYRLPLSALESEHPNDGHTGEVDIEIGTADKKQLRELHDAWLTGDVVLAGDPVYFGVSVKDSSGRDVERNGLGDDAERIMYLPADSAKSATTVVLWDSKLGPRPLPTLFKKVDGRSAAVIQGRWDGLYAPVQATVHFSDIEHHWAAREITDLASRLIVYGVPTDRFAPDVNVTRGELAALIARALALPTGKPAPTFSDVGESSWYKDAVAAVQAAGIMNGFADGTFAPNRIVTRQEAVVTIVRAFRYVKGEALRSGTSSPTELSAYKDGSQVAAWAIEAANTAIREGVLIGNKKQLLLSKPLTRAETVMLLRRMLIKAGLINE
ncbi:invasin domain 3-containing protein [Cohnella soli]|uniref:Invasin domain 3-containing protein n=1 Tax=Cohnella soli TaxID=425005 RepID=A0ABW0HV47_9BACL